MSETLLNEIRATKPSAPPELRERVRALAAQEPARAPFLARFEWKRLVLVAPATLIVAVVAGSVIGLTRDDVVKGGGDDLVASSGATATVTPERATPQPLDAQRNALKGLAAPPTTADSGAPVPPVPGQLQRYEAELRLRVDDVEALSTATKRAQQIALQHSGSVASLQYDAPAEGVGAAQITLRVPTARVQSAMSQLSQLGTIVGQRYGIEDLQVQADTLQKQIEQTQRQIAQLVARLASTTLPLCCRAICCARLVAVESASTSSTRRRSSAS